jgi:hypothetical protein
MTLNNAGQWRAAQDSRNETETQSARPLQQPGWALLSLLVRPRHDGTFDFLNINRSSAKYLGRQSVFLG